MDEPKRSIRVSYTNKATIPTGIAYENQSPCYTITQEIALPEGLEANTEQQWAEGETKYQLEWMKGYVDNLIDKDFRSLTGYREKQVVLDTHRFTVIDGIRYPHVTNIITPFKPDIPFIEDHASLGTKLDEMMKIYVDTGIFAWDDFENSKNIKQTWEDVYQAMSEWIDKYGKEIKFLNHTISIRNHEHRFAGEGDVIGMTNETISFMDFKKTKTLTAELKKKYFMQLAAYAKTVGNIQQLVIISP